MQFYPRANAYRREKIKNSKSNNNVYKVIYSIYTSGKKNF